MLAAIFSDGWTLKNMLIVAVVACIAIAYAAPALWANLKANALSSIVAVIENKLKIDVPDQWFSGAKVAQSEPKSEVDQAMSHVAELVKSAKTQAEVDDLMVYLKKHVSKDQKHA